MGNQLCLPLLNRYKVPSCAVCEKEAGKPYNRLSGLERKTWVFHNGYVYCKICLINSRIEANQKLQNDQYQLRLAQVVAERYSRRPRPPSGLRKVRSGKAWHRSSSFRAPYVESPSVTERLQRMARIASGIALDREALKCPLNVSESESESSDEEYDGRVVEGYEEGFEEGVKKVSDLTDKAEGLEVVDVETIHVNADGSISQGDVCFVVDGMDEEDLDSDGSYHSGDQAYHGCEVGKECEGEASSGGANNETCVVAVGYPLGQGCKPVDSDGENNLEDKEDAESTDSWESSALAEVTDAIQATKSYGDQGRFSFMLDDVGDAESVEATPISNCT